MQLSWMTPGRCQNA